jgi:hypothetical protein
MVSHNALATAWIVFMVNLFIAWLLLVSIFISIYLHNRECNRYRRREEILDCKNFATYKQIEPRVKDEMLLQINMSVTEIYRIDVSCQVGIQMGYELSLEYRNKQKLCSLSSTLMNVNLNLNRSIDIHNSSAEPYEPMLVNELRYNPFKRDEELENQFFGALKSGGRYVPKFLIGKDANCKLESVDYVVFVVTFTRNRLENLALYLINMHAYLMRVQYQFTYKIVVVEQLSGGGNETGSFNKGRLYNIAVKYVIDQQAVEDEVVDCVVLHDVDLVPSVDGAFLGEFGDYRCRIMPWHMSRQVRHMTDYKDHVYSGFLTGGVLSLRLEHYIALNGFSNRYFGWGAEDVCFLFY